MDMLTGGDEYSQERENAENPKAHDEIDSLLEWNDAQMGMSQEDLMNMVMGTVGGGKGINKLMLALKGKIKDGKMIPSQPIRQGMIGKSKPKTIGTIAPKETKDFINKMYGRDKIKPKEGLTEIQKGGKGNLIDYLIAGAGGGYLGQVLLENIPGIQNLQKRLLETSRPDPDMPQKEELDEDMKKIIDMMGAEQNYKHLKNTGQGYPADPEMWYNSEEWLNK